ncbi:MAG TPA: hypothetical protein VGI38_06800 [Puia sp.]
MKPLFGVLIISDCMLFILLTAMLSQFIDSGMPGWFGMGALLFGMLFSALFLLIFIICYMESPRS